MPRLLTLLLLLSLSGCLGIYRAINGIENPDITATKRAAAAAIPCRSDPLQVEDRDSSLHMRFLVTGCGRTVACQEGRERYECFENPPRLADFGDGRLPEGVEDVSSVVSLLTGCQRGDARVEMPDERDRGRLTAKICGRTFLCTMARRERTECTETHLGAAPALEAP